MLQVKVKKAQQELKVNVTGVCVEPDVNADITVWVELRVDAVLHAFWYQQIYIPGLDDVSVLINASIRISSLQR